MTRLESFECKVKYFNQHLKHRFDEDSQLLIAVPGLDLKIGEDPNLTIKKEIEEAEVFADYVKKVIGAQVSILIELDKIDDILKEKSIDCVIDIHELHSKQQDFILEKIKPDLPRHVKYVSLCS